MDATRSVMKLHVAIPALDELEYLPQTLAAIAQQKTSYPFSVYVCVNQPNNWWEKEDKIEICRNNQRLLQFLQNYSEFPIHIIDKSSQNKGWQGNNFGVGWARKTLFEEIFKWANNEDIIISLDADTLFNELYFQSIGDNFKHNKIEVLALPYYHKLTEDEIANRAILRYEIFLRNYFINMFFIDSPYTFTAIGSAIALKIKALRKIRNITPLSSGEDFYLLQKLRKMTSISNYNTEMVYPAARYSTRVCFGTGPAMIKGSQEDWSSYPIYHFSFFEKIKETYDLIPALFTKDIKTEFTDFLQKQHKTSDLWSPLRKNFKTLPQFFRAFHEKVDGLRILQFLKTQQNQLKFSDEQALKENLEFFLQKIEIQKKAESYQEIRELLFQIETYLRHYSTFNK